MRLRLMIALFFLIGLVAAIGAPAAAACQSNYCGG
jgi:hypothetical protein